MRDGDQLVTVVDVAGAARGARHHGPVPTIDGEHELEIPAGIQPNETLTIRGEGIPPLRARAVAAAICGSSSTSSTPRHLKREQRELLEQLAESLTDHNLSTDEGVLGKLKRAFGG